MISFILTKMREQQRLWIDYLARNETVNKNNRQVKKLVRQGIPAKMRGKIWALLVDLPPFKADYPLEYYQQLLAMARNPTSAVQKALEAIEKV